MSSLPPSPPSSDAGPTPDALASISKWETSVLFCFFVLITLLWEFITALLAFITVRQTGRKAIWISRLKNEVLSLGVITLVLSVVQSSLQSICVHGPGTSDDANGFPCPDGYHNLFPYEMIHSVHYLLFFIAITHIIVTFFSFYLSLYRMKAWKKWERQARHGSGVVYGEEGILRLLGANKWIFGLNCLGLSFLPHSITHAEYNLLRVLFRARVDNALEFKGEDPLPRNFNFLLMAQNVMEIDFSEAGDQSFAILVIMALYVLIPSSQRGIYYLSFLAIVHLVIVNAKLHAAVIQLCGTTMKEFQPEMKRAQHSHAPASHLKPTSSHPSHVQMTAPSAASKSPDRKALRVNKVAPAPSPPASPKEVSKAVAKEGPTPPSLMSRLKDRVIVHLLPSSTKTTPSELEDNGASIRLHINSSCKQLYWFGSRGFMSFLFQLGLMELSLALVLLFYGLVIDQANFVQTDGMGWVISCIIIDVFVLVYASLKVQPLAALVSSVGTIHPAKLVAEIKKMKIVLEEAYEEGMGGKLVVTFFGDRDDDSDEEEEGAKKTKEGAKRKGKHGPHMAFVLMLADQAGIVGQGAHASSNRTIPAIHVSLMDLWLTKAKEFKSVKKAARLEKEDEVVSFKNEEGLHNGEEESMGVLKCKLSAIHEAFEEIDQSGDGLISHLELAGMLRELGTRVTREEVEDMILEIDGIEESDGAIDFAEFCLFLSFKFLDYDNDGFVDRVDIVRSLQNLKKSEESVDMLLDYCLAVMNEEENDRASLQNEIKAHRISLACFIRRFRGVELIDESTGAPPRSIEKKKSKKYVNPLSLISDAVAEIPGAIEKIKNVATIANNLSRGDDTGTPGSKKQH